ncbi:sugar ABC transporter permease [Oribacterium sp. C9]|uniref:carbohydrate ABC transporter permease n=1 Tax=Oribacterium sp. C9 TaxID=1943579 RepID=UPI0009900C1B|nr:sugar ABC transporter permease [Oribacterium sp. C9]OON86269.1 sugar ABC transporter permease [Oribacterium sp. C9]
MTKKRSVWPFLLVAPATLIIMCVVFIPVMNAIMMSFQNYDLRRPKDIAFIGLTNYSSALLDKQFINAVIRTILWVIFGVGFQFFFGFVLALILNSHFRGRGFVRAVSMVPWVTPGVLIGLMWRWIYDGNAGVLNDVLMKLNIINDKIAFLSQKPTAFPSVIVTIVWQGIPFFALMLLAALQGVSTDMYEAAEIDGASRLQRLFYITIPSIKNTIFVTGLLRIIWVANSVDVIFNMTEGGPAYSTQTLSVYIYNKANALNLGYASAMAICLALLLLVVVVPYLRMNFKEEK